jgi:hypothetical protein
MAESTYFNTLTILKTGEINLIVNQKERYTASSKNKIESINLLLDNIWSLNPNKEKIQKNYNYVCITNEISANWVVRPTTKKQPFPKNNKNFKVPFSQINKVLLDNAIVDIKKNR